ncbi:hypothetical protein SAMN05216312_103462 [Cohnella sp. OV330]|uniref:hypothetical protein n=1 Tax=Cohnella sp. OV330 TaxID=1855288 RepID=UPI0008F12A09|nr:hypothetical protein [Cohnella sp. OV330]SFB09340.1 hypothetical protein SAMN05216312_103462 [Cohnella sp. OV330]
MDTSPQPSGAPQAQTGAAPTGVQVGAPPAAERPEGQRGRRILRVGVILLAFAAALALLAFLAFLMLRTGDGRSGLQAKPIPNPPSHYDYGTATAANGMTLHYLETAPANVTLNVVRDNVAIAPYYGINGGFFYDSSLLSMAIVDGVPAAGDGSASGGFGSGAENVKYARGTLVWDRKSERLSVQVASKAGELDVTDPAQYWAQGGISMGLGREATWHDQAVAEHAPFMDEPRLRSGAVYDEEGRLYLVVSENRGTLADFRAAILELLGGQGRPALADGIFLDGDGSSQLRSREASLTGDLRPVVQMISLLD